MEKLVALNKYYRHRGWMDNANGISEKLDGKTGITHIGKDADILTDGLISTELTSKFDPVFILPYENWTAKVVIHFQSPKIEAASKLCNEVQLSDGHLKAWDKVLEPLRVPIVECQAFEENSGVNVCGTWDPKYPAIIVKSRGLYAWGTELRNVCKLCESIHTIIESNLDLLSLRVPAASAADAMIVWT